MWPPSVRERSLSHGRRPAQRRPRGPRSGRAAYLMTSRAAVILTCTLPAMSVAAMR